MSDTPILPGMEPAIEAGRAEHAKWEAFTKEIDDAILNIAHQKKLEAFLSSVSDGALRSAIKAGITALKRINASRAPLEVPRQ